jgi:nucleotide-binding universal stress UspA family protein
MAFRNLAGRLNRRSYDSQIMGDIQQLAEQFDLQVETQVAAGNRPENAVLALAERGAFDLLLIGVMPRPTENRLYFGPRVEHMLRNTRCAVALAVSPLAPARD